VVAGATTSTKANNMIKMEKPLKVAYGDNFILQSPLVSDGKFQNWGFLPIHQYYYVILDALMTCRLSLKNTWRAVISPSANGRGLRRRI
jgi:hypothetical protein